MAIQYQVNSFKKETELYVSFHIELILIHHDTVFMKDARAENFIFFYLYIPVLFYKFIYCYILHFILLLFIVIFMQSICIYSNDQQNHVAHMYLYLYVDIYVRTREQVTAKCQ